MHPTALIVDDHVAVRQALCDRIRMSFCDCELRQAGTVPEALEIVASERVDVVLMDFKLPGMDGVRGTRELLVRSPHTAVVMVSMFDDSSHRTAASNAGASAFVCKRDIGRQLVPVLSGLLKIGQSDELQ